MEGPIVVHKGRTKVMTVQMTYDISDDAFTSQIRSGRTINTPLIAEWQVSFLTDGKDGMLVLTLDDAVTSAIDADTGYMDIKRVAGGEPVTVFDDPLPIVFKDVVTV